MIHVMHVITGLGQGGAEAMLIRLLQGLDPQSFSQSVVSLTTRGVYGDLIDAAGISVTSLGMTGFHTLPRTLLRLRQVVAVHHPNIVQTWLYHADLLGLMAARLVSDASVVWNIRCAGLTAGDVSRSTHWLISLLAMHSHRPEAVLFNSMAGQQAHRAIGYRPRSSLTIPNGFDLEEWRPDSRRRSDFRAEIGVADSIFLVGMVARYHRIKDHRCFLDAAARIRLSDANVRFVLAGLGVEWSNQALTADIDARGLRDCVVLLGPRSDMPGMMAGLDCLVLTSKSEGFPNVIGEAMASGVPCVSTNAGDAGLIVGDTGYIVPVGDAIGLASAIIDLLSMTREHRMALSARCRARIGEKFSLDRVLALYANFYQYLDERRKKQTSRK